MLRRLVSADPIKYVNGLWFPKDETHLLPVGRQYQQEVRDASYKYVKHFRCAIDVGAHVGIWTLDLKNHFNKVISFEANPINYQCLKMNLNLDLGVDPYNIGLGKKRGWAITKQMSLGNSGNTALFTHDEGNIPIKTLDEFLYTPNYVKIDVEGWEDSVIEGGLDTIRGAEVVVVELKHGDVARTKKLMDDLGFELKEMISHDAIYVKRI